MFAARTARLLGTAKAKSAVAGSTGIRKSLKRKATSTGTGVEFPEESARELGALLTGMEGNVKQGGNVGFVVSHLDTEDQRQLHWRYIF